jgi:hypothetical protein
MGRYPENSGSIHTHIKYGGCSVKYSVRPRTPLFEAGWLISQEVNCEELVSVHNMLILSP